MSNLPTSSEKAKSKRRWLQFSLSTLFVVTLGVAGFFAGFRMGEERGYEMGVQRRRSETPVTRVYDVAGLGSVAGRREYAPRPSSGSLDPHSRAAPTGPEAVDALEYAAPSPCAPTVDFDSLIDLITTTVAPETWNDVGGRGSIAPHEESLGLVVLQTPVVHEELESLLQKLRENAKAPIPGIPGQTSARTHDRDRSGHPESGDPEEDLK